MCMAKTAKLREQKEAFELEALRLQQNFDAELESKLVGTVRLRSVPLQEEVRAHDWTLEGQRRTAKANRHLKKQLTRVDLLEGEIKLLTAAEESLTKELAATAKQAIVSARAAQQEVVIAQRKGDAATRKAEVAVAKAKREVEAAVARAKSAKALTTEAELEARKLVADCSKQEEAAAKAVEEAEAVMGEAKQMCRLSGSNGRGMRHLMRGCSSARTAGICRLRLVPRTQHVTLFRLVYFVFPANGFIKNACSCIVAGCVVAFRGWGLSGGCFWTCMHIFGIVTTVLCVVDVVYRLGGASKKT